MNSKISLEGNVSGCSNSIASNFGNLSVHQQDAVSNLVLVCMIIIAILMTYFIVCKKWNKYLPESGAAMIFGIIVGGFLKLFSLINLLEHRFYFEPETFYFLLLPPIIFDAGYSMNKKHFFLNMGTILLYAVFGTLISTITFGYGIFLLSKFGIISTIDGTHPVEALMFGAVISATDTVSTLTIMGTQKVDSLLYSLVFGESVLNDAVAIVLFRTLSGFTNTTSFTASEVLKTFGIFAGVSLGSVFVGISIGLFSALFFNRIKALKEHPYLELSLLILFAYVSYLVSEIVQMSGVMSLFICGAVMKHYNWYSLSTESQISTTHVFRTAAFVSETFVFVYLGINLFNATGLHWDPVLIIISLILVLLSRTLNIFPLSLIANILRRTKVSLRMQTVIWYAGGLRGAVAFALALNLKSSNSSVIVTTTLFLVLFTTLLMGSSTAPFINALKLSNESTATELEVLCSENSDTLDEEVLETSNKRMKLLISDSTFPINPSQVSFVHKYWRIFDEKVMKPLFGGRPREGYSIG